MKRTLRITGGSFAGRRVVCPPGVIRPAMDRMRESVFAILGDLSGITFLDLFAGSGIIGLEAASRGAEKVVLVERDIRKRDVIRRNIEIAGGKIELKMLSVERFLSRRGTHELYDCVFLDPPFDYRRKERLLVGLPTAPGATVVLHHPGDYSPTDSPRGPTDRRRYGGSYVDFFQLSVDDSGPVTPPVD